MSATWRVRRDQLRAMESVAKVPDNWYRVVMGGLLREAAGALDDEPVAALEW